MKLYELHRGECFKLLEHPKQPLDIMENADRTKLYILNNIDGMYGNCSDTDRNSYYFAAWTEVEVVGGASSV